MDLAALAGGPNSGLSETRVRMYRPTATTTADSRKGMRRAHSMKAGPAGPEVTASTSVAMTAPKGAPAIASEAPKPLDSLVSAHRT